MREENPKAVTILGSDFALDETSDIRRLLKWKHIEVKELPECNSWKSYQELADSKIFIACYPPGKYGLECQAERLRKKALYLREALIMMRLSGSGRRWSRRLEKMWKRLRV